MTLGNQHITKPIIGSLVLLGLFGLLCLPLFFVEAQDSTILLNELKVNPPGPDSPHEYIEIKGPANASLTNLYFISVEGDGDDAGRVTLLIDLSPQTLGDNGLLIIVSPAHSYTIPANTTIVTNMQLEGSGGLQNGSNSFMLISSTTAIRSGIDYDTDNDGVLELPDGAMILDSLGWSDGGAGDLIYGGAVLMQSVSSPPDAATRFLNNQDASNAAAWYNGNLTGEGAAAVYENVSDNFPEGGRLTPGSENTLKLEPILSLNKMVAPTVVDPGQTVTYTLIMANRGLTVAQGVMLTDVLPSEASGLDLVVQESGTSIIGQGQGFTWTGSINVNQVLTWTFTAQVTGSLGAEFVNTAMLNDDGSLIEAGATANFRVETPTNLFINEVDADQAGMDTAEFIEIYDGGVGNTPLDGLVMVLFNGLNNSSYRTFDLDGFSTDANGYFVLNADSIPNLSDSWLQNGSDAVALYVGDATDFPAGTAIIAANLVDALVYATDNSEESGLLALLNPGQPQVNEDGLGNKEEHSNQRCPDGAGGQRNTVSYKQRIPSPGAANHCSLPNGVAAGDVTQSTAVLWARSIATGPLTFTYATASDFSNSVNRSVMVTDTLKPVTLAVSGLSSNTTYYYKATPSAGDSRQGQFKTAAPVGMTTGLRFGVSGDWFGHLSPYPAVKNVPERNLAFFLEHGDTVYADIPSIVVPLTQAQTITDYRRKHSEVYASRFGVNSLADLRASTAVLATIDDHEVTNNFAGGADAATDTRFPETSGLINDTQLYENALQAFQEYNPLHQEFYGDVGDERMNNERKLYRSLTYGSDAAFIVLDTRSFRDQELPVVADINDQMAIALFLARSFDPNRTILGRRQVEDLKTDLLAAHNQGITWKFIAISVPIQNFGPLAAPDRLEGYAAERTEILKFIDDNNIDNVVFISADVHGTAVNNLTYQDAFTGVQNATNAFEITTGSVAVDPPAGPGVINIGVAAGIITPTTFALYQSLPITNDADSIPNDKDDFIKDLLNDTITQLGYDPLGLNDNLSQVDGLIDATLLQGDYVVLHTFGWTEFEIAPQTKVLTVTTYGTMSYTPTQIISDSETIINQPVEIVSQFVVRPASSGDAMLDLDPARDLNIPITITQKGRSLTTTITAAAGSVTETTQLVYTEITSDNLTAPIPQSFNFGGRSFRIEASQAGIPQLGFMFSKPITITLTYDPTSVSDPTQLELRFYDGSSWSSAGIMFVSSDPVKGIFMATISHPTEFALLEAVANKVYLPLVLK